MRYLNYRRRSIKRFNPCPDSLELRSLLSTSGPDIQMVSTTETNFQTITIDYDVNATVSSFRVAIYRSATDQLNTSADRLITGTTLTGANAALGDHTNVPITISGGLQPDPKHPFVFAVGTGPDNISTDADFQKVVIAAVSHGFEPPQLTNTPPAWETQMAASLQNEGFNYVEAFSWGTTSWIPASGYAVSAGDRLAADLESVVQNPAIVPQGAVVDIELIGHSRGSVVVNEAFTDLQAASSTIPQLGGGYWRETLLDPHPASDATNDLLAYNPSSTISTLAYKATLDIQHHMDDPPINVPSMVSEVQDYYEHTCVTKLGSYWGILKGFYTENYLDPEGLPPARLTLLGNQTTLNSQDVTANGLGHGETHEWFQEFVVPTLGTAKPFVKGPIDAPLRSGSYTSVFSLFKSVNSNYLVRFNDADPTSQPSDFQITINWGDGPKVSKGTALRATIVGGFDVRGSHVYYSGGTYNITVTIKDIAPNGGGSSITLTNTVRVL
jgi:hypothetical protein